MNWLSPVPFPVKKGVLFLLKDRSLMNPGKYKKVCIDFSVRAGIVEVNEKADMESIVESARKAQKVIAKMECHRG